MKIVATTRTRNEEHNIERFCLAYGTFCDEIIIVDGGSTDRTVEIAQSMPKTRVVHFTEKIFGDNNLWRNPHGRHINACIMEAYHSDADWVIFDDCDDVPTIDMQNDIRRIMETTTADGIFAYRLYVFGDDKYFPDMNIPGKSLWAWNPNRCNIYARETDPWVHKIIIPDQVNRLELEKPHCLLHYFAETEDIIEKKMTFYIDSGQHPYIRHPLSAGYGALVSLPEWARWKDEAE